MTGTLLLFVGWFGFNPGSSEGIATEDLAQRAALSAMTTMVAAAAAAATALAVSLLRNRGRTIDLLSMANALLAGLVSISAGADVIDPGPAAVVGIIGALVYLGVAKVVHGLKIDDVVEATAVHGGGGCWGCLAVGLLHRRDGLCYAGSAALLGEQLLGCVVLGALATSATLLTALPLRRAKQLRVTPDQESAGLDREFGLTAYHAMSEAHRELGRCSRVAALLRAEGYTAEGLLEALTALRGIIYRPFTPQAADNKLEGEVKDILAHVKPSSAHMAHTDHHLMFLSHHKVDAGDAARILGDTAARLLTATAAADDEATMSVPPSKDGTQHGERAATDEMRRAVRAMSSHRLFFLDSTDLKDLKGLVDFVRNCSAFVLLLSRQVLTRPWCLVELAAAHAHKKNIVVVMVEFPGAANPRAFRFPQDLEDAIHAWSLYVTVSSPHPNYATRRVLDTAKAMKETAINMTTKMEEEAAALKLQATQRGWQARKTIKETAIKMTIKMEEEAAALMLQAIQRGRQARKNTMRT